MTRVAGSFKTENIEAVLSVLRSVLPGRYAVYVSTPITTGRNFYRLQEPGSEVTSSRDRDRTAAQDAEAQNRARARRVIAGLRRKFNKPLIDPTQPELPGWTWDDYHVLSLAVIRTFAEGVIFLDGWEYSRGCAWEFLTACEEGLKMYRETLTPLTETEGRRMLEEAHAALAAAGHDVRSHARVLKQLAAQPAVRKSL